MREANPFEHQEPVRGSRQPENDVGPPAGKFGQTNEPEPGNRSNPSEPGEIQRGKRSPEEQRAERSHSQRDRKKTMCVRICRGWRGNRKVEALLGLARFQFLFCKLQHSTTSFLPTSREVTASRGIC